MAILFFGVQGPTLDLRQDLEILDTDAPRIMAYLMSSSFGQVTENVVSPDGLSQGWVTRAATPEETAANYAKAVLASLLNETVAFEKAAAAKAAADAVQPIEPVVPPAPEPVPEPEPEPAPVDPEPAPVDPAPVE